MSSEPSKILEVFPNPEPDRPYTITMDCPEFTCLGPRTGQPDFATLRIRYVPDKLCIELKSVKLYLWSYRNEGAFHEAVVNRILDDLTQACKPRFMEITGDFFVRGGIHTVVKAATGVEPPATPQRRLD
jgi:7-cyano-7-deazaguanine reductase